DDSLPLSDADSERAKQIAEELAPSHKTDHIFQAAFVLARKLKGISPGDPTRFEPAVAHFCELAGRSFDEFYISFLRIWNRVRQADGEDILAWAHAKAIREPYPLPVRLTPMAQIVCSMAWHLSVMQGNSPFFLPRPKLAELLDATPQTISNIV